MGKLTRARELEYSSIDEMMADVEKLLEGGYERSGNWSLGQAASHVADWAEYPMVGFPTPPAPLRAVFWVLRKTGYAGRMAEQIKSEGFKPGVPTAPQTVPASDYADEEGVEKLRGVVQSLDAFDGELHASPLFGEMDKATLLHVTLLHAAHHMSFLRPKTTNA